MHAQPVYEEAATEDLEIFYRVWTEHHGLPSWDISGFFRDSRGHYWLQSSKFIMRFDGERFTYVDTVLPATNREVEFSEDKTGHIWYIKQPEDGSADIIRIIDPFTFKRSSFTDYTGVEAPFGNNALTIRLFSIKNMVYVFSTSQQILWGYDGAWRILFKDRIPAVGDQIDYFVFPGPDGNLFWRIDKGNYISLVHQDGSILRSYKNQSTTGAQLFFTQAQLYAYNTDPSHPYFLKSRSLFTDKSLQSALQPSRYSMIDLPGWGGIYSDTLHNITFYVDDAKRLLVYKHTNGTITDVFAAISDESEILKNYNTGWRSVLRYFLLDRDKTSGSFFLPLYGHGLMQVRVEQKNFTTLGEGRSYRQLQIDGDAHIIATNATVVDAEYYRIQRKNKTIETFNLPNIPYGLNHHNGFTWFGLRDSGITVLDANNRVKKQYSTESDVYCITHINDTIVWYGGKNGVWALNKYSGAKKHILKLENAALWMHKDRRGDYWVATQNGLYHMPTKQAYLQDEIDGQPLEIQHIYESTDGTFWLSTLQGLVKWRPYSSSLNLFNRKVGMRSAELHAAYPDRFGRLWLSSNDGIMVFDTTTRAVLNFTVADGIATNELNYLAHCQTQDGVLYFGGINGITAFDPNAILNPAIQGWYDLRITEIAQYSPSGDLVTAQQFGIQDSGMITLNRKGMHGTLYFTFPYYSAIKPGLQWRIKGLNPNWTALDVTQPLIIYGIPHGNTTLEVRAEDPTYAGVYTTWQFPLYKPFFWYQLLWVRVLFVLTGLLILIYGIRWWLFRQRNKERNLEKLVQERTETIRAQKKTLEQIDTAKTQLFNNISHEFRTPLSLINAMSSQIKTRFSNEPDALAATQQIDHQVTQLTGMLNDVMDLSKMQVGALRVNPVYVDWTSFLTRIYASFDGLAQKKKIHYRLHILPIEPHYITLDSNLAERIITNLLSNAFKFTPEKGIISLQSTFTQKTLTVRVIDSGPGVGPYEAETIFQRYVQGSAADNAPQPGYGIGLALCKEYTSLLGGKIWVEPNTGKGAVFVLKIPCNQIEVVSEEKPSQQLKVEETMPEPTAPVGNRTRILVVEDNPDFAQYLQKLLAKEYDVVVADNGEKAWHQIQKDPHIALVLTDVMMPLLDGFTLLQKIRSNPQIGYLPVVFVTALTADDERLKALRLGVDAYLSKPFPEEELLTRLAHLVLRQQDRKRYVKERIAQVEEVEETLSYDEVWMNEFERVIRENLHNADFKVSKLAYAMHITERTLLNKLKQYTGQSPSSYLRKVRLEQAYQYLKTRKYQTIKEVAHATGFNNPQYFNILFKEEFGITAAEAKAKSKSSH